MADSALGTDIEVKLGDSTEADEAPDYTEDAQHDAGAKLCVALGIVEGKASTVVRALRQLLPLLRDED